MICQGIVREMSGNFGPTQMWQPCSGKMGMIFDDLLVILGLPL